MICTELGEHEFSKLSPEEQRAIDQLVWVRCCMHKELNTAKGRYTRMSKYWVRMGLPRPLKLMNWDNATAFNIGNDSAKEQASSASQGSAVKLMTLAGSLFNHSNNKKGQQDSYNNFFEERLGYCVKFPDTSNTRYQSHCEAATVLLHHHNLYIEFMELIRDKKEMRTFNHMESNVYHALKDPATLEELFVLAVFYIAISRPYMHCVWGRDHQNINALDLGPLHHEILNFMHQIIEKPSLILGEQATYETATFDKQPFDSPEGFELIKSSHESYHNIDGLLLEFFYWGSRNLWSLFCRV